MRARLPKGMAEHSVWLIFGMIMLVVTGGLIYVMLPHSDCDRMADVSAQEIKAAIECAAKYDSLKDPATGKDCNVASVRLCQEDSFTIYGVGYVQAFLGLMVPEYMIYYQQFPTEQYKTLWQGGTFGFVESYPFERAFYGQRPGDSRPTLTQFKQFYKTQFLQKPCTSGQGLCYNIRGREEVVEVGGTVPDVRLLRPGLDWAEDNPKFYVVAPCYGKVTFTKGTDGRIYGRPERFTTPGASNYCYMDEGGLMAVMGLYTGEKSCQAAMIALDILSLGSKAAAEKTAQVAGTKILKEGVEAESKVIIREAVEVTIKSVGKNAFGKAVEIKGAKLAVRDVFKKMVCWKFKATTVRESVESSVRRGMLKVEKELGETGAFSGREAAIREITEEVIASSTEETLESAMRKGMTAGAEKAKLMASVDATQISTTQIVESGMEELLEETSTKLASEASTGLKGLSVKTQAWITARAVGHKYANMQGLPTRRADQLLLGFGAIPCVDVDVCRGVAACGEVFMWPGYPFNQLTDAQMKGGKAIDSTIDVFTECCTQYNYGVEKDTAKIICKDPDYLVDLIKADLKLNSSDDVTLAKAGAYLGLTTDKIPNACALAIGDNTRECRDSEEVKAQHLVESCLVDSSTNTYNFESVRPAGTVTVMARLYDENCPTATELVVDIANDTGVERQWKEVKRAAALPYPENNFIEIGANSFQYIRVSETGGCYFDSTGIVLGQTSSTTTQAEANTPYNVGGGGYSYFIVPVDYAGKASALCNNVKYCTAVARWQTSDSDWQRWADEGSGPMGDDFDIIGLDRIGIYATENSKVSFNTATE